MTAEKPSSYSSPASDDPVTGERVARDVIARIHLVASALNDVVEPDEIVELIVRQGMAGLDADGGIVATVRDDGLLHAAATVGYPSSVVRRFLPMALHVDTPLTRAITTDRAVFVATAAERSEFAGLSGDEAVGIALAALPLTVEGDTFGALGVSFRADRPLSETERSYIHILADVCASALARIEWRDELPAATSGARTGDSPRSSALNNVRLGAMHLTSSTNELRDCDDADLADTVTSTLETLNMVVQEIQARALAASIWYDDPIL